MPNETPKFEKITTPEDVRTAVELHKRIMQKMDSIDANLRALKDKMNRPDQAYMREELASLFGDLEMKKKTLAESLPEIPEVHPAYKIDDQLRDMEHQMNSGTLRKDEQAAMEQNFDTLQAQKKEMLGEAGEPVITPADTDPVVPEPEPEIPDVTLEADDAPEPEPEPVNPSPVPPQPTPAESESNQQENSDQARIKSIVDKIKSDPPSPLSVDDMTFRAQHWAAIEVELINRSKVVHLTPTVAPSSIETKS